MTDSRLNSDGFSVTASLATRRAGESWMAKAIGAKHAKKSRTESSISSMPSSVVAAAGSTPT